jgi:indoleamine 2,3-dioxygenase
MQDVPMHNQTGFLLTPAPPRSFLELDCGLEKDILEALEEVKLCLPQTLSDTNPQAISSILANINYNSIYKECKVKYCLDTVFILYGYLASAWIHGLHEKILPKFISIPLVELAKTLNLPPMLSYAGQVLGNWHLIDPEQGFIPRNLSLIYHFTELIDEAWFFRVHMAIEAQAGDMLMALIEVQAAIAEEDDAEVHDCLRRMRSGLVQITRTFHEMPDLCDPDVYFQQVRPLLMSFGEDTIFEGVEPNPTPLRGGSGAQSSIVPTMLAGLGLAHDSTELTSSLNDMRRYMPLEHRQFIAEMAKNPLRDYCKTRPPLRDAYNHVLRQLITFRRAHLYYARTYIFEKSPNQMGSGGTSYLSFLSKLIDETVHQML